MTVLRALALTALVCLVPAACTSAATVYVDTIGNGSAYQIGSDLVRTLPLGYDSHPLSGDLTGSRPKSPVAGQSEVSHWGTTGVPCSQLYVGGGVLEGQLANWVIQPFTPTSSFYATSVEFIAQWRPTAGFDTNADPLFGLPAPGTVAYVDIIPASTPSGPWTISPVPVGVGRAKRGALLTAAGMLSRRLTAGTTYWVVFAPTAQRGQWTASGLDYANLNWARKSHVDPLPSTLAGELLFSGNNGLAPWVTGSDMVLGFRVAGYASEPTEVSSVGEAKELADGTRVRISGVRVSGNSGALAAGTFYVQQPDRSSGIRVVGSVSNLEGDEVVLTGTLATDASSGERQLIMEEIGWSGNTEGLTPVFAVNRSVGGASSQKAQGPDGGVGLNNVGLLIAAEGLVISKSGNSFEIDDGSAVPLKCYGVTGMPVFAVGSTVSVTGVVSLENSGSGRRAVVLARKAADVKRIL